MGTAQRPRPKRLATKLKEIRLKLGFTQEQMVAKLVDTKVPLKAGHISEYETDKREPPLVVLLCYARLGSVQVECLIDDDLDIS